MIRALGILIGLGFLASAFWSLGNGVWLYTHSSHELTAEQRLHEEPRRISFSFDGPLGNWHRAQLQRGFQVYKEVCAACHSLNFVAFRNLRDLGYSEAEVRAIAEIGRASCRERVQMSV